MQTLLDMVAAFSHVVVCPVVERKELDLLEQTKPANSVANTASL